MSDLQNKSDRAARPATPGAVKTVALPRRRPVAIRVTVDSGRAGRRRRLLAALPALLTLTASAVLLLGMRGPDLTERYEREASDALLAGNYDKARVCFERLLQHSPGEAGYLQGLSLAAGAAHDRPRQGR